MGTKKIYEIVKIIGAVSAISGLLVGGGIWLGTISANTNKNSENIDAIKEDLSYMRSDLSDLKKDVAVLKDDVDAIKVKLNLTEQPTSF